MMRGSGVLGLRWVWMGECLPGMHLQQNGSATSRPRWLRNDRKDEITPAGIVTDERRVGKLFGKL